MVVRILWKERRDRRDVMQVKLPTSRVQELSYHNGHGRRYVGACRGVAGISSGRNPCAKPLIGHKYRIYWSSRVINRPIQIFISSTI